MVHVPAAEILIFRREEGNSAAVFLYPLTCTAIKQSDHSILSFSRHLLLRGVKRNDNVLIAGRKTELIDENTGISRMNIYMAYHEFCISFISIG